VVAIINADVLVIGSGCSGLMAAIEARKVGTDVAIASKGLMSNCTAMAGGGINAAIDSTSTQDSPKIHFQDTMAAGRYVNDARLVKKFVVNAPRLIDTLRELGVQFKSVGGRLTKDKRAGHTTPRTLQICGEPPTVGISLLKPLIQMARYLGVRFYEGITIVDLIREGNSVQGAIGVDKQNNRIVAIEAKSTILCTGGLGHLYSNTNNPQGIVGDGYAMAIRAGARLLDMEFVQFYPFNICEPGLPRWNVGYEQVVEAGGRFVNEEEEDFLAAFTRQEISGTTRDKLALAVAFVLKNGDSVFLDLQGVPDDSWKNLPKLAKIWEKYGLEEKKIRVAPVAHFFMGGIKIDEDSKTDVENLYAAGEATGGIHGANRLSGNALSESLVFGAIAGRKAGENAKSHRIQPLDEEKLNDVVKEVLGFYHNRIYNGEDHRKLRNFIRSVMWDCVGLIRNRPSLEQALRTFEEIGQESSMERPIEDVSSLVNSLEIQTMLTMGEIIATSALIRQESRGSHFRTDFPGEDETWLRNIVVSMEKGRPRFEAFQTRPANFDEIA